MVRGGIFPGEMSFTNFCGQRICVCWLYVGGLSVSVEGPSKAQLTCVDNKDGNCSASYFPTEPGEYKVNVKFAEEHIAGSPFTAKITPGGMHCA